MKNFKLIITCTKMLKAYGLKMLLNGQEIEVPKEQKPISINISDGNYTLYVCFADNKYRIHSVEKSILIQSQNCPSDTILCELSVKLNLLGTSTMGILAPQFKIESKMSYL